MVRFAHLKTSSLSRVCSAPGVVVHLGPNDCELNLNSLVKMEMHMQFVYPFRLSKNNVYGTLWKRLFSQYDIKYDETTKVQ